MLSHPGLIAFILFELLINNAFGQNDCLKNKTIDHPLKDANTIFLLGGSIDLANEVDHIQHTKTNFELRFYCEERISGSGKMFQVSCSDGELIAKKYAYEDVYTLKGDSITNITTKIIDKKTLVCKIPLTSFVDSLIAHRFLTLPTMSKENYIITDTLMSNGLEVYRTSMPYILDGTRYTYQSKIGTDVYTCEYENPESYLRLFPKDEQLIMATGIIHLFETYFKESD